MKGKNIVRKKFIFDDVTDVITESQHRVDSVKGIV